MLLNHLLVGTQCDTGNVIQISCNQYRKIICFENCTKLWVFRIVMTLLIYFRSGPTGHDLDIQ